MRTGPFRELIVWQRAMELAEEVYRFTESFPSGEKFGLVSQMRRCAVSIPSNIAEGKMRGTDPEFKRFLKIAYGSGAELETQLELSRRLPGMTELKPDAAEILLDEVMKMLNKLSSSPNG